MNMKTSIAAALLLLLAGNMSSQEIKLPEQPDAAVGTAGSELRHYSAKLLNGRKSDTVFLLEIDPKLQPEEWKIQSAADAVRLTGGSDRGVLYAVYHYLEHILHPR